MLSTPNSLTDELTDPALRPMKPLETKEDPIVDLNANTILGGDTFSQAEQLAASGIFGSSQVENSFGRQIPVPPLPVEETSINNLETKII